VDGWPTDNHNDNCTENRSEDRAEEWSRDLRCDAAKHREVKGMEVGVRSGSGGGGCTGSRCGGDGGRGPGGGGSGRDSYVRSGFYESDGYSGGGKAALLQEESNNAPGPAAAVATASAGASISGGGCGGGDGWCSGTGAKDRNDRERLLRRAVRFGADDLASKSVIPSGRGDGDRGNDGRGDDPCDQISGAADAVSDVLVSTFVDVGAAYLGAVIGKQARA
jgi:hypothetical protein